LQTAFLAVITVIL